MNRRRPNQQKPQQNRKERDDPSRDDGTRSRPAMLGQEDEKGEPDVGFDHEMTIGATAATSNDDDERHAEWRNSHDVKIRSKRSSSRTRTSSFRVLAAGVLLVIVGLAAVVLIVRLELLDSFRVLQAATLLPVAMVGISALLPGKLRLSTRTRARQSHHHLMLSDRALSAALVLSVVGAQLPIVVGAALACAALLLFALVTLPSDPHIQDDGRAAGRNDDGTNKSTTSVNTMTPLSNSTASTNTATVTRPIQIINAAVLLLVVLLTENFMVWVVSATFRAGQHPDTEPPPLQDNGRIVLQFLLRGYTKQQVVQGLRRLWNVQWSLVACVAASFAAVDVWHHPRRQLYGVARRAVLTLAMARALRTISFLLTVLPSQVPHCYRQRFPDPPPINWWPWIQVGLLPASHGGCNDLIVSGHATVVTTLACVATSVSSDSMFRAALWILLVMDFAIEVYEGFHYSVDMWLGLVLVCLIWRTFRPLENEQPRIDDNSRRTSDGSLRRTFRRATKVDVGWYGIPTAITYMQVTGTFPKSLANGVIVGFVVAGVVAFVRSVQLGKPAKAAAAAVPTRRPAGASSSSYVHYAQHILLCTGLITLVTYL